MSYLDVPRFNIGGKFYTYPSTVNNDPTHYEVGNTNPSPWQTPSGDHHFKFIDCLVRSAIDQNGSLENDPIIGASISTVADSKMNMVSQTGDGNTPSPKPVVAKLVDLDVYQQGVPTIYGMKFIITLPDGSAISGDIAPPTLNQLWWLSVQAKRSWADGTYGTDSNGGDMNACGIFISVIRIQEADWPDTSSTFLNKLKSTTLKDGSEYLLSLRFVVDGYQNVPENEDFCYGRLVASIGPVSEREPKYNPGQRWLTGRPINRNKDPWYYPTFNTCPFKIDETRKKLVIDLANGICRQSPGGPPMDLGHVTAYVQNMDPPSIPIGEVNYSAFSYENNAHIAELDMTDDQISNLKAGELVLRMDREDLGVQEIFSEKRGVLNYCVEVRPMRLEGKAGTIGTATVYINNKGVPVANKQMNVTIESVHGDTPGATVPPKNPDGTINQGNTPQAEGAISARISATDSNGYATLTVSVNKDPGMRTPQLDGQLYYIIVSDPDQPPTSWETNAPPQSHYVSCVVFSNYPENKNPEWSEVQEIMRPYAKLYPGMTSLIDLTDQHAFNTFAVNPPWKLYYDKSSYSNGDINLNSGAIPYFLTRDFNDPMYMPISRDMSQAKINTVLYYRQNLQKQHSSENPSNA